MNNLKPPPDVRVEFEFEWFRFNLMLAFEPWPLAAWEFGPYRFVQDGQWSDSWSKFGIDRHWSGGHGMVGFSFGFGRIQASWSRDDEPREPGTGGLP